MRSTFEGSAFAVGVTALALLLLSATYECGYFFNVGFNFQTFLSVSDYLANAVLLVPFALVVGGWRSRHMFRKADRHDGGRWPLPSLVPESAGSPIEVTWFTLRVGIPCLAGAFLLGWLSAERDLKTFSDPYTIQLKTTGQKVSRIIVRNFEKGLLVRTPPDNGLAFLRWSEIAEIGKSGSGPNY